MTCPMFLHDLEQEDFLKIEAKEAVTTDCERWDREA